MSRQDIPYVKKLIRKRISEIIRDYLFDSDESYCYIDLYFEKSNGENQHKRLKWGAPSEYTPDRFRDRPHGFNDTTEPWIKLSEVLEKKIVWCYSDGRPWDGKTLSQIRAERENNE